MPHLVLRLKRQQVSYFDKTAKILIYYENPNCSSVLEEPETARIRGKGGILAKLTWKNKKNPITSIMLSVIG